MNNKKSYLCDACGQLWIDKSQITVAGGALFCRACWPIAAEEIKNRREIKKTNRINLKNIAAGMLSKKYKLSSHFFRDIPDPLWQDLRNIALLENQTVRKIIIKAFLGYLEQNKDSVVQSPKVSEKKLSDLL